MIDKYKTYVLFQLVTNPDTRANDKLLIRNVCEAKYNTTDINDLLEVEGNPFESIRRCRQYLQRSNPRLRPSKKVKAARAKKEIEVRAEVKQ